MPTNKKKTLLPNIITDLHLGNGDMFAFMFSMWEGFRLGYIDTGTILDYDRQIDVEINFRTRSGSLFPSSWRCDCDLSVTRDCDCDCDCDLGCITACLPRCDVTQTFVRKQDVRVCRGWGNADYVLTRLGLSETMVPCSKHTNHQHHLMLPR